MVTTKLNSIGKSLLLWTLLFIDFKSIHASSPTAVTIPACRITFNSAWLNCSVNPSGASTTVSFEYGFTTSYDSIISISGTLSGSKLMFKTVTLTGLYPGRTYHYRVKAANSSGTTYGSDMTFTTGSNFSFSSCVSDHTILLSSDGIVYSFGLNSKGQLGDNSTTSRKAPVKVLKGAYNGTTYLGDNPSNPIIATAAGLYHSLALAADGTVFAFGYNSNGQLGDNSTTDRITPVRVLAGAYKGSTYLGDNSSNPIIGISAGRRHSLALAADGTVYSFGFNNNCQLGDSSKTDRLTPVRVAKGSYNGKRYLGDDPVNPIITISSGGDHNLILAADGVVFSFGFNSDGQLGDSSKIDAIIPIKSLKGSYSGSKYLGDNPANPIIAVAGGGMHSMALSAEGLVYTFGHNTNGKLGDNTANGSLLPLKVLKGAYNGKTYLGDSANNRCIDIHAGWHQSLSLSEAGNVFTFGYNYYGQLGDNTTTNRYVPIKALKGGYNGSSYLGDDASNPIAAISSGQYSTIAMSRDGLVYAIGYNIYGQLGDNSTTHRYSPVKVVGIGGSGNLDLIACPSSKANVGSPKAICEGDSISIGVKAVSGYNYSWTSKPGGFTSGLANPTVSPKTKTIYYLTQTSIVTGCKYSDSVTISVNPLPKADVGQPKTICLGDSTILGAIAISGSVYVWTSNPSGFTSSFANPKVAPNDTLRYILTETITATGCKKSDSVMVNVNPLPLAGVGTSSTICQADSTKVGDNAIGGSLYAWTSKPIGFSSSLANPMVSPDVTTKYFLTETITATGCKSSDSVTVHVNPLPKSDVGQAKSICYGDSVIIGVKAVVGNTYAWTSKPVGFSSAQSDPMVVPKVTSTYYLTETIAATGCKSSDSVTVSVNALPKADVGLDKTICYGDSVIVGVKAVGGNTYNWTSKPVGFSSVQSNPSVIPKVTTTYYLTETTTATGCKSSDSVTVNVNTLPKADVGQAKTICYGDSVIIGVKAVGGNTYNWTSKPVGFSSVQSNPTVIPKVTTTYYLTETATATGCKSSDSVTVNVDTLPIANVGQDITICYGDSARIGVKAVNGNSYNWYSLPVGFSSGLANPSVSPKVKTKFFLTETIIATGCKKLDSVTIYLNPLPLADAGKSMIICFGDSALIGADPVVGNTYSWVSSPAGFNSGISKTWVHPVVTTIYTLTEKVKLSKCVSTRSVEIRVNPLPAIPKITRTGNNLISDALSGNQWYRNGLILTGATSQSYLGTANGKYKVQVTDSNGCSTYSDEMDFTVLAIKPAYNADRINIYPNPNNGRLYLNINNCDFNKGLVMVLDFTGKVYFNKEMTFECDITHPQINLKGIEKGIYIIEILSNSGKIYRNKFMVE